MNASGWLHHAQYIFDVYGGNRIFLHFGHFRAGVSVRPTYVLIQCWLLADLLIRSTHDWHNVIHAAWVSNCALHRLHLRVMTVDPIVVQSSYMLCTMNQCVWSTLIQSPRVLSIRQRALESRQVSCLEIVLFGILIYESCLAFQLLSFEIFLVVLIAF